MLQPGWCAAGPIARACGGYDLGVHRLDDDGLRVLCYAYEAARREAYVYAVQPPRMRGWFVLTRMFHAHYAIQPQKARHETWRGDAFQCAPAATAPCYGAVYLGLPRRAQTGRETRYLPVPSQRESPRHLQTPFKSTPSTRLEGKVAAHRLCPPPPSLEHPWHLPQR